MFYFYTPWKLKEKNSLKENLVSWCFQWIQMWSICLKWVNMFPHEDFLYFDFSFLATITAWKVSVFGVILVRISRYSVHCGEIRSISQYSVWMRENTGQNNSKYEHFLRCLWWNTEHSIMSAKSIAYKKRLYNFVSSALPDKIFRPNIKCVFFLFSVCKTKKEEEQSETGRAVIAHLFPRSDQEKWSTPCFSNYWYKFLNIWSPTSLTLTHH